MREQGCLTERGDWEASLVLEYGGHSKYRKGCHAKEAVDQFCLTSGIGNKTTDENYRDVDFHPLFKR